MPAQPHTPHASSLPTTAQGISGSGKVGGDTDLANNGVELDDATIDRMDVDEIENPLEVAPEASRVEKIPAWWKNISFPVMAKQISSMKDVFPYTRVSEMGEGQDYYGKKVFGTKILW